MTRREYLVGAAAAAGQLRAQRPAAAPGAPTAPPPSAKITSSVALAMLAGSFEDRVLIAAKAGMQGVELEREYAGWDDAALAKARKFVDSFGMRIDAIAAAPGWTEPGWTKQSAIGEALAAARKLSCPQVILPVGNEPPAASFPQQLETASSAAEAAGITLLLPANVPDALKLVQGAGTPHVRLLFDLNDQNMKGGDLLAAVKEAVDYTGVFRLTDAPGKGEIKNREIYQAIRKAGYSRYICMKYVLSGDPVASLIRAVDGLRAALTERPLVTSS